MSTSHVLTYGAQPYMDTHLIEWLPVAASQVIAKGDWLVMNASGNLQIGLANSAALYGVAAAAKTTTATLTATDIIPVFVAHPLAQFLQRCENTPTSALNGDMVDIIGATGAMYVDDNASATKVLQIIRVYDDAGDSGAHTPVVVACVKSQYYGTEV